MERNEMQRSKLYILSDECPYRLGEDTFILPEIEALKEKFDIILISAVPKDAIMRCELPKQCEGIKVLRFSPWDGKKISFYKFFLLFWVNKACLSEVKEIAKAREKVFLRVWKSMHFYARAEGLYRWMRKNNVIDQGKGIYYSYWYNDRVLAITMHKDKYPNLKIITRAHGYDLFDERMEETMRQPYKEVMDLSVDRVIFASNYGLQYYLKRMKMLSNTKYVLYRLGVPGTAGCTKWKKNKRFHIVSCSNIIPLKRVSLLIDSLSEIQDIEIEWVHFGDGKDRGNIEAYAKEKLIERENIYYQLKGYVSNDKIYDFYSNNYIDCFITLSSSEGGAPVSIQEAMAFGIPIIGTATGGITEMINGNGYLLSSNPTTKEVVNAIKAMYRLEKKDYILMRKKSFEIWKNEYNLEKNIQAFSKFLEEL